jgi:uncharacterized protein (DUF885 family)
MSPGALRAGVITAFVVGCGGAGPPESVPRPQSPSVVAAVAERYLAEQREGQSAMPDLSREQLRRAADTASHWLALLGGIDEARLTPEDRISRDVLRWEAEKLIQDTTLYWYRFDALPAISPLRTIAARLAAQPLASAADRDRYLVLLADAARGLAGLEAKMRAQTARGIVVPMTEIDRIIQYLRSHLGPGAKSPFAGTQRMGTVPPAEVAGFQDRVARSIDRAVDPAINSVIAYLDTAWRARAPADVGIGQYPGGLDAYRILVRRETTLDISPEAIHTLAVAAMAALEARMKAVRDSLGFRGTKAEFHAQLRRDPRFFVATPAEVGQRLMAYADRIEPVMSRAFNGRPRAPYGVRRLDPALEPSMTYGYYNWPLGDDPKGYYNFNGSDLDQRSLLMVGAIAFHELIPGHHYHINRQRENERLPPFRRTALATGYTEGWAEYVSSVVAADLGMYRDGYEIYGRLVFDAFFIARLVVDTGMNFHGWPRSRAIAYMREHTLESDLQIDSETLRYSIRSPAQALAYRMGREAMVGFRAKAERALGSRFDLATFHDVVLDTGSLPLFLLEREIDRWIARGGTR